MNININLNAIQEKAANLVQAGAAQTKKLATIAKLKSDNLAQRDALRKAYIAIGKQYYAAACEGEVDEAFADSFAKASAALAAIAANNAALADLKAPEEVLVDVDIDVEMQAGEMPEDAEAAVDEAIEDVAGAVDEVTEADFAEDAPAEDAPAGDDPQE